MEKSRNKFRGLSFLPNFRLHTHVYLWTKLRLNFVKRTSINFFCFRYIDDAFFIWTDGKEKPSLILEDLNRFRPNIKFSHELNKESI